MKLIGDRTGTRAYVGAAVLTLTLLFTLFSGVLHFSGDIPTHQDTASPLMDEGSIPFSDAERTGEFTNVNLYFKEGPKMNTTAPSNNTPSVDTLGDGERLDFSTDQPLYDNLDVKATVDQDMNAFKLFFTTVYTGNTACSVTIRIFDGAKAIAENSFGEEDLRTNPKFIYFIPEVAPGSEYQFQKGSRIRVSINASVQEGPLSGAVTLSYDSTNTDSHLSLFTDHMREMDAGTERDGVTLSSFYPNLGEGERYADIVGNVTDVMGDQDISEIKVTIMDPDDIPAAVLNATLLLGPKDQHMGFFTRWNYPGGHPPGTYPVHVRITDRSGSQFNASTELEMREFGVRINADITEQTGVPLGTTEFTIRVLNIGGSQDAILLEAESDPVWDLSIPGSVEVLPGEESLVDLGITVPGDAEGGEFSHITVSATSQGDGGEKDNLPQPLKLTVQSSYVFEAGVEGDTIREISPGAAADYIITLFNTGDLADTVDIHIPVLPSGWGLEVTGDTLEGQSSGGGSGYYSLYLTSGSEAVFHIIITAPVSPDSPTQAVLSVEFNSRNDTGMTKTITLTASTSFSTGRIVLSADDEELTSSYDSANDEFLELKFYLGLDNLHEEDQVFSISVGPDMVGWTLDYQETLQVSAMSKESFTVSVKPPDDALCTEDGGLQFRVSAEPFNKSLPASMSADLTLIAVVDYHYDMTVEALDGLDLTISSKDTSLDFRFKVMNNGNCVDNIIISDEDASGWKVDYTGELILSSKEDKIVTVTLEPPEDLENGDEKEIEITFKSAAGNEVVNTIRLEVDTPLSERFSSLFTKDELNFWIIFVLFIFLLVIILRIQYHLKGSRGKN